MNRAVQVEDASRIEGTNRMAIIAVELQIIYRWSTLLRLWPWSVIDPNTLFNNMHDRYVIDQINAAPLADGNG